MARALAVKSLDLQHLAVAGLVSAKDFLEQCDPAWRWQHLESLALTSLLVNDWYPLGPELVLCRAALLINRMPQLRTLVIWCCPKNNGFAFVFQRDKDKASITKHHSPLVDLSEHVYESWRRAARSLGIEDLAIRRPPRLRDVRSRSDAIHRLQLPCPVITPESIWQIHDETHGTVYNYSDY